MPLPSSLTPPFGSLVVSEPLFQTILSARVRGFDEHWLEEVLELADDWVVDLVQDVRATAKVPASSHFRNRSRGSNSNKGSVGRADEARYEFVGEAVSFNLDGNLSDTVEADDGGEEDAAGGDEEEARANATTTVSIRENQLLVKASSCTSVEPIPMTRASCYDEGGLWSLVNGEE